MLSMKVAQVVAVIVLSCAWGSAPSGAIAGAFDADSDMLGVRLSASLEASKENIKQKYINAASYDFPMTIASDVYKKSLNLGAFFDLTSKDESASNMEKQASLKRDMEARKAAGLASGSPLDRPVGSVGDFGAERLMLLSLPTGAGGADTVLGVGRVKVFPSDKRPLVETLANSLIDKYGPPLISKVENGRFSLYFWSTEKNLRPSSRGSYSCFKDSFSYLWEDPGSGFTNYYGQNSQVDSARSNYLNVFNNVNAFSDLSNCGKMLRVILKHSADGAYATTLEASMIDLRGIITEIKKEREAFSRESKAIKDHKIDNDRNLKAPL